MSSITTFRGASGEVIRSFCSSATILTALPIVIIWIVVLVPAIFLTNLRARHGDASSGDLYLTIIFTIVHASMVGRFALPATRGDLSRGFFDPELEWSEVIAFVGRYLAVSVGWAILIWLIGKAVVGQLGSMVSESSSMFMGGVGEVGTGISYTLFTALLMLYFGLVLIGPLISFLVAISAQSVTDVFSSHVWRWIFWERAGDLPAFFASIIGAIIILYIKISIPLMFLAALIGKASPAIGFFIMLFAALLPVLASPVLIGRMCGAFVFGADRLNSFGGAGSSAADGASMGAPVSTSAAPYSSSSGLGGVDFRTTPTEIDIAPPTLRRPAGELGELTIDPPSELLQRLREIGAKYPGMQRVHLCGGDPIVVVVELGSELSLKDRQVIRNDLNSLTSIVESIRIEVPHEDRLKKAQAVGLRVYERRG